MRFSRSIVVFLLQFGQEHSKEKQQLVQEEIALLEVNS